MESKAVKFVVAGAFLTLAVIVLAVTTLKKPDVSLTHYTPAQLLAASPAELASRGIQVDGIVAEGTERFNPNVPELRFKVRNLDQTAENADPETTFIEVVYRAGLKPDSFKEGQGVVVEGRYDPATRTIEASKLMTKCPSKYEASGEALKTMGSRKPTPSVETARKPEETR